MAEQQQVGQNEPPSHHGGLENLDTEHSYWIDDYEGQIPADLEGTFFRNGPGRQRIGDSKYGHWFDGDGCIFSTMIIPFLNWGKCITGYTGYWCIPYCSEC